VNGKVRYLHHLIKMRDDVLQTPQVVGSQTGIRKYDKFLHVSYFIVFN